MILRSDFDFSSWQCPCNNCRFLYSSLPPAAVGMMWSVSILGLRIVCQLHHYYQSNCSCGHQSTSQPGVGITSLVEGRTNDLKLTEYVLVGSSFASLIASLAVRYRLSRVKIREFLVDWFGVPLSVGTIDRCVREAGIACKPVVEDLLAQLQQASVLYIDETPWYQKGKLYWLWVAIESKTAVFRIAPRTKEEFQHLVKETFVGWLITDGKACLST